MTGRGLGRGLKIPSVLTRTPTQSSQTTSFAGDTTETETGSVVEAPDKTSVEDKKGSSGFCGSEEKKDSNSGPSTSSGLTIGRGLLNIRGGKSLGRGLSTTLNTTRTTLSSEEDSEKGKDKGDSGVSSRPKITTGRALGRGLIPHITQQFKKLDTHSEVASEKEKDKCTTKSTGTSKSDTKSEDLVLTPVLKHGNDGQKVKILTNYIRMNCDAEYGVFEYNVSFHPNVESQRLRSRFLFQHKDVIGNSSTFDGVVLYLPKKLPDEETVFSSVDQTDNSEIQIKIKYKKQKRVQDCIHLYNLLFERIFKVLKYQRVGRKQFDPSVPKIIPQHKLEIWPGKKLIKFQSMF